MYLAMSATAPFTDHMILSQTTDSGLWSFIHCTSWYHYSEDTSVFPSMALPLKMLIQMVPSHKPVAIVFIRCPTSSSGWVGAGGQSGCPMG